MFTTLCVKCTIMITALCVKCTIMITTLCVKCTIYTWSSPRAPLLYHGMQLSICMYKLSLSTCMYEILRWRDIPEPVFFQDFFLDGIYRANGSLWSLRNVYDRQYDPVNCHGWARITSAARSQIMSFLVYHILPDMNHRSVAMSNTTDGCN